MHVKRGRWQVLRISTDGKMSNIDNSVGSGRLRNLVGVALETITLTACSDDDGGSTPSDDDAIVAGTLMAPSIATEANEMLNKQW